MGSICFRLWGNMGCHALQCKKTHLQPLKADQFNIYAFDALDHILFGSFLCMTAEFLFYKVLSRLEEKILFLSFGLDVDFSSPSPPSSGEWSIA